eukprot:TRINITY_DN43139_c0_g1_i1.p1 TRINITY_DN43139_c0_g1~~TRINITY_DN43139_c0_g1_i1.p1  ORF type:complete len:625 (-),score=101.72 TRINITY_DN43139_c0_g1_i1:283-2157(-)
MARRSNNKLARDLHLCCKGSNLTDDSILDISVPSNGELSFESVDFSMNALTAKGLQRVVDICRRCNKLRILKLYKNQLGDDAALVLSTVFKHCPSLQEIHASHNGFTAEGAETIIRAAERHRPESSMPLWLRLEQNHIANPGEVFLHLLEHCKLSICARKDRDACTNRNCAFFKKVHLPHFELQAAVEGSSKDSRTARSLQKSAHLERRSRLDGESKDSSTTRQLQRSAHFERRARLESDSRESSMTRPSQRSRRNTAVETSEPPQTPANDSSPGDSSCLVQGLPEFLAELKLEMYLQDILAWAEKMGAAFLEEIIENAEELAEDLKLRPLEKKRLLQKGIAGGRSLDVGALTAEQERVEVDTFWSERFQDRLEEFKQVYRDLRRTQVERLREFENDETHAMLCEIQALEVDDIDDVEGVPLYIFFKKEDWVLLEIKYQLHLIVHAFALRPREPDEYPGIPLSLLQPSFKQIFRKPLEPERFGLHGLDKLISLASDTVSISSDHGALQPLQMENVPIAWFVKSTEDRRRQRQCLVDAGDEAAQLTMDVARVKPSCRPELPLPRQQLPSGSSSLSEHPNFECDSSLVDEPRDPLLRRRRRKRVRVRTDSRSPPSEHAQRLRRRVL